MAMEPKVQNVAFAMARHAQRRPITLPPRTPSCGAGSTESVDRRPCPGSWPALPAT